MRREYELNETEQRHLDVIKQVARENGGMVAMDRFGDPIVTDGEIQYVDWTALRGGSHLVDKHMRVWEMRKKGTPKFGARGGAPHRKDYVIMWTGAWNVRTDESGKPILGPDGKPQHVKYTVPISLAKNVNAHRGASHIDWHMNEKGFKHPLDPPDSPDEAMEAAKTRQSDDMMGVVLAKAAEAGIEPDIATGKAKPPPLDTLTVMKLRSIAKQRGLEVSDIDGEGAKQAIIARIQAAEAGALVGAGVGAVRSNKREHT